MYNLCTVTLSVVQQALSVSQLSHSVYHNESTQSHQNSEVKRGWARLVLG